MTGDEYKKFEAELKAVVEVIDYRASVSDTAMKRWWASLKPYPLPLVLKALSQHEKTSKFTPKPADIIEFLMKMDGRPGENEAWAMALKSRCESETVVWTEETSEAFFLAQEILKAKDKQGAKMAFREIYLSLVEQARKELKPARWSVSLGSDEQKRSAAVNDAFKSKKISQKYVLAHPASDISDSGRAISKLLSTSSVSDDAKLSGRIAKVRAAINGVN